MTYKNYSMPTAFLTTALLLSGVIGAHLIYLLLIAMIAISLISMAKRQGLWIAGETASLFFALAFVLFLVGFMLSADSAPDIIFALNYSPMLLFAPLAAFLAGKAASNNTQILAWGSLAGLIVILATAAVQVLVGGVHRAHGFEIDPIAMGHTAVMLGFIAVSGFPIVKGWHRYLLLLAPFLGIAAALLTGSRGPVIAAVPLALIALIYLTRRPFLSILGVALASIALVAALAIVWPSAYARLETVYRIALNLATEGVVQEHSTGLRLEMYYGAMRAFFDSPWIGHGWENKFAALTPYFPPDWAGFRGHHHLHADLADTAVASGVIGLIAYGLILAAPIVGALRSPRDSQYRSRVCLALMLSVGYFFFGLTYLLFGYEYHTTFYVILAAAIIGYCRDETPLLQGQRGRAEGNSGFVGGSTS